MPEINDKNLQKLQKLLAIVDEDTLTRGEFVDYFEKVVQLVLAIQKEQGEAIDRIEETHKNLTERNRNDYVSGLADLKKQTNELFVADRLKAMDEETKESFRKLQDMLNDMFGGKMMELEEHKTKSTISLSKFHATIEASVNMKLKEAESVLKVFKDGLGDRDARMKKIEEAIRLIREALSSSGRRFGMRKVPITRYQYLTSQVDGSTTSFTLDRDTVRVHGVLSTQFPGIFNTTDWTHSGNTLTVGGGQIGTIQAGQTLVAVTEVLFYP